MASDVSGEHGNGGRNRTRRARQAAATVAILVGIALIVETFALSLFADAAGGDRVTDRFRATLSSQGLATLQRDFGNVRAMANQFFGQTVPAVGKELHLNKPQLDALIKQRYPAVWEARQEIPPALAFVGPAVPQIVGLHDDFKAVDSLPAFGLPLTATPWILIGGGALLIALGLVALRRPDGARTAALLVAGVGLVVVPLALSIPHKADAADHVDKVGRLTLSEKAGATSNKTMQVTEAMIGQVDNKLVPDLAKATHQNPTTVATGIAHAYPAVARGLVEWPGHLKPAGYALAHATRASVNDFKQLDDLPFKALPWLVMGPGIVLALAAAGALVVGRRRQSAAP